MMKKPVILLLVMFMLLMPMACAKETQPAPSPLPPPPPASSPSYPNHGITTTKAEPKPGDNIFRSSSLPWDLTTDDLIEESDAVVIGKVVDILPARQVGIGVSRRHWIITTDVIIEIERYLYGQPQSPHIAVMVQGGRVEQTFVRVEDQPEFNLGEKVALFLKRHQQEIAPPEGFEDAEYYMVTGSFLGKFGYKDGNMVNLEGDSFTVAEFEQKIASIRGR